MEKIKEEAFEYYQRYRNLNDYYYKTDNPEIRGRFDQWAKEFCDKLQKEESKLNQNDEVKLIEGDKSKFYSIY
jgi:hypothetical protein